MILLACAGLVTAGIAFEMVHHAHSMHVEHMYLAKVSISGVATETTFHMQVLAV